ncbi:AVID protein, partial [Catharus fuscescens]|nr:AVID protein [Catharus fuscescens]
AADTSAEFSPLQCSLSGNWVNDLGSNMTIEAVNGDGNFGGSYHTAVSASPNEIKVSPLQGSM